MISATTVWILKNITGAGRGGGRREGELLFFFFLALLEVLGEHVQGLAVLTVRGDGDGGAGDDLAGVALLVDLAETDHLAELLVLGDLDEVDVVLVAESLDQLDVVGLITVLGQDAEEGLALVKDLDGLAETAGDAVVEHGLLEHFLEGLLDAHLSAGGGGKSNISF